MEENACITESPSCTAEVKHCKLTVLLLLSCFSHIRLCDPTDCGPPGSSVHGHSPGKNTRVCCHALFQGIFPTQESNPGLLQCRQILYHWAGILQLKNTDRKTLTHFMSRIHCIYVPHLPYLSSLQYDPLWPQAPLPLPLFNMSMAPHNSQDKIKDPQPRKGFPNIPCTHMPVPSDTFTSSSTWEVGHDGLVKTFLVSECFFLFFSSKDTIDPSKPISNVTSEKVPKYSFFCSYWYLSHRLL